MPKLPITERKITGYPDNMIQLLIPESGEFPRFPESIKMNLENSVRKGEIFDLNGRASISLFNRSFPYVSIGNTYFIWVDERNEWVGFSYKVKYSDEGWRGQDEEVDVRGPFKLGQRHAEIICKAHASNNVSLERILTTHPLLLSSKSILELPEIVDSISSEKRDSFFRMYHLTREVGHLDLPESMLGFAVKQFTVPGETVDDTLRKIEHQRILTVTNLLTKDSASFNELRALRPIQVFGGDSELTKLIEDSSNKCPFENPENNTPRDVFPEGRIYGEHCVTASNVAKYTPWHGLVIFKEHNPLKFTCEQFRDYIRTALKWFEKVNAYDPNAIYPVIGWNCLSKSGASITHGHMQTMLRSVQLGHYPQAEELKKIASAYSEPRESGSRRYIDGVNVYFNDLYNIYQSLGLAYAHGGKVIANLTPAKEKEVLIFGRDTCGRGFFHEEGAGFELMSMVDTIHNVLRCYIDQLGVRSFNMAIYFPQIFDNRTSFNEWSRFPPIVRIVDRGNPMVQTADMGIVEVLLGEKIIGNDPYRLIGALAKQQS